MFLSVACECSSIGGLTGQQHIGQQVVGRGGTNGNGKWLDVLVEWPFVPFPKSAVRGTAMRPRALGRNKQVPPDLRMRVSTYLPRRL